MTNKEYTIAWMCYWGFASPALLVWAILITYLLGLESYGWPVFMIYLPISYLSYRIFDKQLENEGI